ncbi:MAG: ftsW [Gammaproteobacteria bacterium]|jgi:cell division protein FtsW|nr:ftsW [Gammaproteobacteria bacterium]MDF3055756.1 ftsW [Gammaproteobacteria bacterium]
MSNAASSRRVMSPPVPYDRWLIFTVASLAGLGLLMVASASIVISDQQLHQPFYYLFRQLMGLTLGVLLGGIVVQFDSNVWKKMDGWLLVITMLLLALVLLPGVGHAVNGSARWIGYGVFKIQVSELAKFAVVVYMAGYLVRRNRDVKTHLGGFLKPMLLLGVIALLLLCEPDFGATVVIVTTALGMMFLAGMRLQYFVMLFVGVLLAMTILAVSEPYRIARLTTFLNPWVHPFNSGYQLTQSLIAIGRGGWVGVGLGNSIQKQFYLPESHTDFLFSVIGEELGLVGMLVVIGLFTFLSLRIFWIGRQAQKLERHFAGFLAYGFGLWLAMQFTVSIGVNLGVLPTKGLTLPLLSYGGSSMLVNCVVVALLLRIDYENRMIKLGLKDG